MSRFPYAHATHPQWRMAAGLVLAQLRAQVALGGYAQQPTLGLLYITDHYAEHAQDVLDLLSSELPEVTDWSGTVGVGVAANNVEYFDEPALVVMLCELPADQYRVFSGVAPLPMGFDAQAALVHADGHTPELDELLHELSDRTSSGYLFGGLLASRTRPVQFAQSSNGHLQGQGRATGVFTGGLSGVAFGDGIGLVSRVTQGCQPVSRTRRVTASERNLVKELDGQPALGQLLADLGVSLDDPQTALHAMRQTLVGLVDAPTGSDSHPEAGPARPGNFGSDVRVRHIIGLDPANQGVAVADHVSSGMQLAFCQRNVKAARADLVRICAEIREELDTTELPLTPAMATIELESSAPTQARQIAGAIYVSCSGRGGPHFGGDSAELQIVRQALGDVPLIGFFAGGEIAHRHVHGYTGVLTVFTAPG
ncbi:MAG: hypothetical protein RLZZ126_1565 [Pseudomonadota bacterium]|jgi:small ligand-binding sensory domain FIST